ncbi:GNAT family N-acetyltransferase [Nicoliella lavandulae]|uniref:GNAT family N-acetyltransferase n=1 Tax=Nicoliella lavandulae TaxID=3082954 RepID=A0ABU8SID2_9LACO
MKAITISQLQLTDAHAFFAMVSDATTANAAGFDVITSLQAATDLLRIELSQSNGLAVKYGGQTVGCVFFYPQVDQFGQPMADRFEVGFLMHPKFSGRGIMTQGLALALQWLQRQFDVARIIANVSITNDASKAVLLHNHFAQLGTFIAFSGDERLQFELVIVKECKKSYN